VDRTSASNHDLKSVLRCRQATSNQKGKIDMPTKEERPEDEAPTTNVKAGFPGVTTSNMPTDAPGAQPTQPPADKDGTQRGQEGPSVSASPGPHTIDDGSEPLPGQPEKDSASSAEEVRVRTESPKTKK
jgi:hypothetical protein